MNYKKLYYTFIEKFKGQKFEDGVYTERHHILPRYRGGSDDESNIVRLTHRQHTFVHHLWARYTNDPQAWLAYRMMSGQVEDKKREVARLGGIVNRESGHIDRIRLLANTPERQRKLKELHVRMREDGTQMRNMKAAIDAWRGSKHTEEFKKNKSKDYKHRFKVDPKYRDQILSMQKIGVIAKAKKNRDEYEFAIGNAERNEEYIGLTRNASKYTFISPEGLEFGSVTDASRYLGTVEPYAVDNWCKRGQYGWKRVPKEVQE